MPFKSKAQAAKIAQLEKEGKVKKGTTKEWAKATKDIKNLPERLAPKKPFKSVEEVKKYANKKYGK